MVLAACTGASGPTEEGRVRDVDRYALRAEQDEGLGHASVRVRVRVRVRARVRVRVQSSEFIRAYKQQTD
jgi:hypothetical protein